MKLKFMFILLISLVTVSYSSEQDAPISPDLSSFTEDGSNKIIDKMEVYTIPYFQARALGGLGFGYALRLKNNKHALELDGNVSTVLFMSSAEISSSYLYYPKNQSNADKARGFSAGMGLAYSVLMDVRENFTFLTPVLQIGYEGNRGFCSVTAHVMRGISPRISVYPALKFNLRY